MGSVAPGPASGAGQGVALWRLLQGAAGVLLQVLEGRSATAVLEQVDSSLRPGVRALSYLALRRLGAAQALRVLLARKAPPPPADSLLCCALALLLPEQNQPGDPPTDPADGAPYDAHTLVNQAVEAAKRDGKTSPQANFINACLRRFLRERETLLRQIQQDPVARWNHPNWWLRRLKADYPDQWRAILEASNQQAPMTLRVNLRRGSVQDCLDLLQHAGLKAWRSGPSALDLEQAQPVLAIPGFAEGRWSVQDAAAQMAAPLLLGDVVSEGQPALGRGLLVLDACAAPGGKTAHLLEMADCQVIALDIDAARCDHIHQSLLRLGLQARVIAGDAALPQAWLPALGLGTPGTKEVFDAILLDAPCTASGIVRRHPDVRWLRRESDITQLAKTQARLLTALWPLLKPGGRLLYAVCSVFREEGEGQVSSFLANNSNALLRPAPGHLLPQSAGSEHGLRDNRSGGHDGFFYALLEKAQP